ncbi:MAG: N-acetyltransferase family protein [Caldilineae bacterium]|nr:MAG: N-acetyltransferase family protein [Caldilineae bacterium]
MNSAQRDYHVRAATPDDAVALARIYGPYVRDSIVTFEEVPPTPADMAQRLQMTLDASLPWLVAERGGEVRGFAHASRWKGRCAYRFAVEVTVYVEQGYAGLGIGSLLYGRLLPQLRDGGMHTALAGIALPNPASIALHEKFGFRKVAHFRQVGFKFGRWIDVGYWQLMLEQPD